MIDVYIIIDEEIVTQQVPYGGNASKPSVPEIPGKKFIGWDGSFTNITEETTIMAIFEDEEITTTAQTSEYITVSISINGQITKQQVKRGGSPVMPNVSEPGYTFLGWDSSTYNLTQDCTITAILVPNGDTPVGTTAATLPTLDSSNESHVVTFVIDGVPYPVTVPHGGTAVPPITPPSVNSSGQTFIAWDSATSNITNDTYITAIYL